LVSMGVLNAVAWGPKVPPQEDWGAPAVSVTDDNGNWVIAGQRHKVILNAADLSMTVEAGPVTWKLLPSVGDDMTVEVAGKVFKLRLVDAGKIQISPYETGFKSGAKIHLSQFQHENRSLGLELQLFVCLEGTEEDLVCEVVPTEKTASIKQLLWPKGFTPDSSDFTVLPLRQGMLLPRNWPKKTWLNVKGACYGRGLYMPWWGHLKAKSAAMVILETPVDSGCEFKHPPGGPTWAAPRWMNSLGRLSYPRRARLCFLERGNHVDLAKRYRRYAIETGLFVSLKEKIARNPVVRTMIGRPHIGVMILHNVRPSSSAYNKDDPARNYWCIPFDKRAEQLRKLASRLDAKNMKHPYIKLLAWPFRGFGLHPDNLPPSPEAGGWDGMRLFADTCDELDCVLAVHDNYRDYYLDTKSYNERHTIIRADGSRGFMNGCAGGKASFLRPRLALRHVKKNFRAILAHRVKLRGAYLDVFSAVPPCECYNPEHPATRADCLKYWGDCLDFIRTQIGVVSSEDAPDWAIPHLDLVHSAAYATHGGGQGIPLPLQSLVYHDAILVPWPIGKAEHCIPYNDRGYLHGLLNAGVPRMSANPTEAELTLAKTMCALHQRVGLLEMTNHEFLDKKYRKQRTTFADGTTVTIGLDADTFQIAPELDVPSHRKATP